MWLQEEVTGKNGESQEREPKIRKSRTTSRGGFVTQKVTSQLIEM